MRTNTRALVMTDLVLFFGLGSPLAHAQWTAPSTKNLPPEIVKQMDPDILAGKRPTFFLRSSTRVSLDFGMNRSLPRILYALSLIQTNYPRCKSTSLEIG